MGTRHNRNLANLVRGAGMRVFVLTNSEREFHGVYSNLFDAQVAMRELESIKDDGYWITEHTLDK